jgi:hypothetical protein
LTIQFGAVSGFSGSSCLKSFCFPLGVDPQRALVPSASAEQSGRAVFPVDAMVVFLIQPDAGFDFAELERCGLSKTAIDDAGLVLPKVCAVRCARCLLLRVSPLLNCASVFTHAAFACVAVRSARAGGGCRLLPAVHRLCCTWCPDWRLCL